MDVRERNVLTLSDTLVSSLVAGLVSGLVVLISCVSFAALIFNGSLADHVFVGITASISTAVIAGSVIALLSACRPVVALPDDDTVPVLALMVTLVIATLPENITPEIRVITALGSLAAVALVTGLALSLLGLFKLGGLVRYLPHSVMGGYFAGAGLLMVLGGIKVATDLPLSSLSEFKFLFTAEYLVRWLPACTVALLLNLSLPRWPSSYTLPLLFGFCCAAFFLVASVQGMNPSALMDGGWLLGPLPESGGQLFNPILLSGASDIQWSALLRNPGSVLTIIMLSAVSLMLTVSGLSLGQHEAVDINRELSVAGLANAVSGLSGGLTALPSMALSRLAIDVGAPKSRLVGLVVAGFCALVFYYGLGMLAWLPKPVLAGLLIYLGWTFLQQWLFQARSQMPALEFSVIWIILAVVVIIGFLEGVFVGILCAVMLFVINYSRINVVRYSLTGAQLTSNVERNSAQTEYLATRGEEILIAKLQGYLFFGTAAELSARLEAMQESESTNKLRYLIYDFDEVTDMDTSAAISFIRLAQEAVQSNFNLVLTGMSVDLLRQLQSSGFNYQEMDCVQVFQDLDLGLEWCEEQLLAGHVEAIVAESIMQQFASELGSEEEMKVLLSYFDKRTAELGEVLAREGEPSDELFLLESCGASVFLGTDLETKHRIRRASSGTVFGEVGFYLGSARTASVVVDEGGELFVFSQQQREKLDVEQPHIAAKFHGFMLRMVTRRLKLTTSTLRAVLA